MEGNNKLFLEKIALVKDQLPLNYQKVQLVYDSTNLAADTPILKEVSASAYNTTKMIVSPSPKWISRVIMFPDVI